MLTRKKIFTLILILLCTFNLAPLKTLAQQPPSPEQQQMIMAQILQIASSYGFDQATFMQLVGELQTSRDPQALAGILDNYGVDSLTLNAFVDDISKAGLAPALGTMLDLSLAGEVATALDDMAAEQFLSDYGISEDDLAAFLADLAGADPSTLDIEALGLTDQDIMYILYALDVIDAFDGLEAEAGLDADSYYDAYIVAVDPAVVLEFYGLDEAALDALLAGGDFSDPALLADYLWAQGIDPDIFGELAGAFADDAFFTDLLTSYALDAALLDALVAEMEYQELLINYGMTDEEFAAFVEELAASGDYEALMAAYGLSLDDVDGLLSDLDSLEAELLDIDADLTSLEAELDALEAEVSEMDAAEDAGSEGEGDAGGEDEAGGEDAGSEGEGEAGGEDAGGEGEGDAGGEGEGTGG